jgi:hypothetical protein
MNALLLDDGWTAEGVAEALFSDAEPVRAHRRPHAAGGRVGWSGWPMSATPWC